MTTKQRRSLARYTAQIAVELGLRDWSLIFAPEACEAEANADVTPTPGRRQAVIRFADHFAHLPPEEQREAVVHELIHLHFASEQQAIATGLLPLGQEARTVANDNVVLQHEFGVDALASAIAHFYPLWEGA